MILSHLLDSEHNSAQWPKNGQKIKEEFPNPFTNLLLSRRYVSSGAETASPWKDSWLLGFEPMTLSLVLLISCALTVKAIWAYSLYQVLTMNWVLWTTWVRFEILTNICIECGHCATGGKCYNKKLMFDQSGRTGGLQLGLSPIAIARHHEKAPGRKFLPILVAAAVRLSRWKTENDLLWPVLWNVLYYVERCMNHT